MQTDLSQVCLHYLGANVDRSDQYRHSKWLLQAFHKHSWNAIRSCCARQPNRLARADGLNDRIGPIFWCSRHFNLRPQSRELTEGGLACLQVRLQRLVIVTQLVELQERGVIHEANRLFQHNCLSEIDGNAVASAFRRTSQQCRLDAYGAKIRGQEITDDAYAMRKLRLIR